MGTKKTSRKKTSRKKNTGSLRHWFLRYHVTLWVIVGALTVLAAFVAVHLPDTGTDAPSISPGKRVRHTVHKTVPEKQIPAGRQYEEADVSLETRIKEVDLAIIQTLVLMGYDPSGIEHGRVEIRAHNGHEYHFQRLELASPKDTDAFVLDLKQNIDTLVGGGRLRYDQIDHVVSVTIAGTKTHDIVFAGRDDRPVPVENVPDKGGSRMVIVVDDLGRSETAGKRLAGLTFPVTFSVMPHEPHSRRLADIARRAGREVILHLPMQPESYPETDPGPGALFVNMGREEITRTVTGDLAQVPGVTGANNHMGSRFTQDPDGMDAVLSVFHDRNLFFLDSLTTPKSCAAELSSKCRVPYLRRNVFLDNVRDEKAILFQLRKAQSLAGRTGTCVAIGHPYPETLEALSAWQRMRDPAVRMVRLKDLL
ncbi:divergent polysaccharide deacetylase family protein [Desulfoplanes sp.]